MITGIYSAIGGCIAAAMKVRSIATESNLRGRTKRITIADCVGATFQGGGRGWAAVDRCKATRIGAVWNQGQRTMVPRGKRQIKALFVTVAMAMLAVGVAWLRH